MCRRTRFLRRVVRRARVVVPSCVLHAAVFGAVAAGLTAAMAESAGSWCTQLTSADEATITLNLCSVSNALRRSSR
jgi:hypothetical protein